MIYGCPQFDHGYPQLELLISINIFVDIHKYISGDPQIWKIMDIHKYIYGYEQFHLWISTNGIVDIHKYKY